MSLDEPPVDVADALFGKTRKAVLGLLFGQPDRAFYTREVVQAANSGISQVQLELDRLTRSGLVTRERRGRQVYFRANDKGALFSELVGLVAKTVGVRDVVREALQPVRERIRQAFIYGSIAKGEAHAESDVDLLIVGDVLLGDLDQGLRAAESRLGRRISVTLLDAPEFGQRLADQDHFLTRVLAGPRIPVIGDVGPFEARDGKSAR